MQTTETINQNERWGFSFMRPVLRLGAAALLAAMASACELTEEEVGAIEPPLTPVDPGPGIEPDDQVGPLCYRETFTQPDAEITKKVDLLFVLDTSGSIVEERAAIGDGAGAFVDALPADVDIRFGVMLAHINTSYAGRLYQHDKVHPPVLSATDYTRENLRKVLQDRLRNVKTENESDGGEAGLISLTKALSEENMMASRDLGFFRSDAALVVVFVADENDICARFPAGVTPVRDPDRKEAPAFAKYCANVTPDSVYSALQAHQGQRPLVVSGVIYHPESMMPRVGENEIGYGYLELIDLAKGPKVDLADSRFHIGLNQIGNLTTKKLSLVTEFDLLKSDFDQETLNVRVDAQPVEFEYQESLNRIHLPAYAGRERSIVAVDYCMAPIENPEDREDPVLITGFRAVWVTGNSFKVTWNTDRPATTQISVRDARRGTTVLSDQDPELTTYHEIVMTGLEAATLYTVRAISERGKNVTVSEPIGILTSLVADDNF